MKTRCFALAAFVVLFFGAASADTTPGIQLPADGDEYSTLVARAAAHDVTVDFRALRLAHLKSRAHQRGGDEFESESALRKEMYEASRKIETATMVRQKAEALSRSITPTWKRINFSGRLASSCTTMLARTCIISSNSDC